MIYVLTIYVLTIDEWSASEKRMYLNHISIFLYEFHHDYNHFIFSNVLFYESFRKYDRFSDVSNAFLIEWDDCFVNTPVKVTVEYRTMWR